MADWDIHSDEIYEPLYYSEEMKRILAEEFTRLLAEESERTA